nr:immunoglobulin heavy chain junction region [Mus musculus]MBK4198382.1 immunoglobulin heavy chain junction region [Mus musculus]MBK4198383.1 immunoglobulin heavy chain junction region [Mus musculus]MBK4198384.1 immunoglobulin heavy chain junction region [Mus musculus]MBK4198385.1 immunoglobulin heavy chain junction region [Mus musculus]
CAREGGLWYFDVW